MHSISIDLATAKEDGEIRELASSAGSEEEEIYEMIREDVVFLAKKKGNTVGFIALRSMDEEACLEISGLAIREDQRRQGVASLLLEHAEGYAHNHKAEKLIVTTSNDNIPALAFFQKKRFTIREVKLGTMIGHHGGKEIPGWEKIPVRDEIVLQKSPP